MSTIFSYIFIISLLACNLSYGETEGEGGDGDDSDYDYENTSNRPSKPIYKVVDKNGNISFSDQPQSQATEIKLQDTNTVPKVTTRERANPKTTVTETSNKLSYKTLAITYPADGGAIANGLVPFNVNANISPKLQKGHILWLLINGQRHSSNTQSTIIVPSLDRGQHTLQLIITDSTNSTLKQSATSTINVLRPSIR